MTYNLELTYLRRVGHMRSDACAIVIVSDTYYAQGFRCIIRQLAEVHDIRRLFLRHETYSHRQGGIDDFIDLGLDCGNLPVRRTGVEDIVSFAFLPLDVGIAGTRAPEHVDHSAVKYMLSRVRRLVFCFVM